MKKRTIVFLVCSLSNMVCFLIALLAIGFKTGPLAGNQHYNLGDISSLIHHWSIYPGSNFLQSSYSLLVLGLVLMSLAVIGTGLWFDFWFMKVKIKQKKTAYFWLNFAVLCLTFSAFVFILTGELVFMIHFYRFYKLHRQNPNNPIGLPSNLELLSFDQFWNTGYMAGLLIFTLLPWGLTIIPYFWKVPKNTLRDQLAKPKKPNRSGC